MGDVMAVRSVDIDEFNAISIEIRLHEHEEPPAPEPPARDRYPAKTHARKVQSHLKVSSGLIYLPGQKELDWEDSDAEMPFRQRRYAFYLSGADFPGVVVTYDIAKDHLTLWIPVRKPAQVVWTGALPSIEECTARYDVDAVRDFTGLDAYLKDLLDPKNNPPVVYVLHENQRPSVSVVELDDTILEPAMSKSRAIKTPYEIKQIRKAVGISSEAHRAVQRSIKALTSEAQVENVFLSKCRELGAKRQAYPPIAGSGPNAAVLHYSANDEAFGDSQLMVLDAGAEYNCYASDITRTLPLNGIFSDEAKRIYQIVADVQNTCISMIRPGASWRDIETKARELVYSGLLNIGILQPGRMGQPADLAVTRLFYMHGLGHLVGLDTHDVIIDVGLRGFWDKRRAWETSAATSLMSLEKDMVVTVEPGIYFNRAYIEMGLVTTPELVQHIDKKVLEKYYPVCGCRLEDCVLITEDGHENLTTAPKGDEMFKVINGES